MTNKQKLIKIMLSNNSPEKKSFLELIKSLGIKIKIEKDYSISILYIDQEDFNLLVLCKNSFFFVKMNDNPEHFFLRSKDNVLYNTDLYDVVL